MSEVLIDLPKQGRRSVCLAKFWIRNPLHPAPLHAPDTHSSQIQVPYTPARWEKRTWEAVGMARFGGTTEWGSGGHGFVVGKGWHKRTAYTAQGERKGKDHPGKEGGREC